jgi:uncharacterized protein
MRKKPKAVVDTNIFISALLGSSNAGKILDKFISGKFDILISKDILDELLEVIGRKKFSNIFRPGEIKRLTDLLETDAEIIIPGHRISSACKDPKDYIILACAAEGKADYIITGDNGLLEISPFRKTKIITPSQFLKLI